MENSILSNLTVLVFDYGNFSYVSEKFAKSFGRTLLYCPYEEGFPKYNKFMIGSGIPGVEKVQSFWPYFDQIDLFYFADLYQGEFQAWLRNQGKAVFGSGKGEDMELLRDMMKRKQQDLKMDLNDYEVIHGFDNLQNYLENNDDKYIKTNTLRGGMETWHHENIMLSKPILDELNHSLGVFKNNQTFIAESPIDSVCEVGYDGFCGEGIYPSKVMFGLEVKDSSYCCVFTDYQRLPIPLKEINKALSPSLEDYGYRGWVSTEVKMISADKGILLDFTARNGEPPTSLAIEMLEDYPLYCWQIAIGEIPNVKSKFKYGAQIIIKSDWAREEPQPIYFPSEYTDYVKIKNLVIQDGVRYFVPIPAQTMCEIGAVIGCGNTLQQAIDQAKKVAKEIKGYTLEINGSALDDAAEEIKKLSKLGISLF